MPRFNLRTILWLFLVAALCVGWWADHRRQAEIQKHLLDRERNIVEAWMWTDQMQKSVDRQRVELEATVMDVEIENLRLRKIVDQRQGD